MAARSGGRAAKKIFHKIGEVCAQTQTEPYVLRYWESEFPFLAPEKNRAGQRIYTDEDIQTVLAIKRLLYEEGYTTAGARRKLEQERREPAVAEGASAAPPPARSVAAPTTEAAEPTTAAEAGPADAYRAALVRLRDDLRAVRSILDGARED
jgi:DNA-binding transcriptional MerR regulator